MNFRKLTASARLFFMPVDNTLCGFLYGFPVGDLYWSQDDLNTELAV